MFLLLAHHCVNVGRVCLAFYCGNATNVLWISLHFIAARVLCFFFEARVLWFLLGQGYYNFHGDKGIMVFNRGKGSIGEVFYQGILIGILGQVWCLTASIFDLCPLSYFVGIPLVIGYYIAIHQGDS